MEHLFLFFLLVWQWGLRCPRFQWWSTALASADCGTPYYGDTKRTQKTANCSRALEMKTGCVIIK
ncbi:MAG: hypothetical protein K2P35_11625 [Lachnospiraceae bacterium]|nr:hypothetical protein [Lachnospiraceae bacterium]